jgi:hypothetical protein
MVDPKADVARIRQEHLGRNVPHADARWLGKLRRGWLPPPALPAIRSWQNFPASPHELRPVDVYFTPFSIMVFNIKTGYGGIKHVPNEEIAILVSSLHRVQELGIPFVFTNQHAYPAAAEFFSDLADLERVDWPLLQSRNFKHDPDDPGKKERYQAEALIWKHLPINAVLGVCCYNQAANSWIQSETAWRKLEIQINTQPGWYF